MLEFSATEFTKKQKSVKVEKLNKSSLPSESVFICMNHEMSSQFAFCRELLRANFAFFAVHPREVKFLVTSQLLNALEAQIAKVAGKRSVGCVNQLKRDILVSLDAWFNDDNLNTW
jgi:hypothetical protein